jgi:ribose transport system substrate-binding protein
MVAREKWMNHKFRIVKSMIAKKSAINPLNVCFLQIESHTRRYDILHCGITIVPAHKSNSSVSAAAPAARNSDVQSVARACEILKYLQRATGGVGLDAICKGTELPRPTTYRLLSTLVNSGMIERVSKNSYRLVMPRSRKKLRIGYASQSEEFSFSRMVSDSIRSSAYRAGIELLVLDNHYSPKVAIRNAAVFVRQHVDLVIEFQTNHQSASLVTSKLLEAGIPIIAIEIPHPRAIYYGADNYRAGVIGGRALGKACLQQ